MDQNVVPLLDSARNLVDEVRGTAEFVGESAVSPIIRVYSIVSGVRRGLDSLGSLGAASGADHEPGRRSRDR